MMMIKDVCLIEMIFFFMKAGFLNDRRKKKREKDEKKWSEPSCEKKWLEP
jgi:hypothetical protein